MSIKSSLKKLLDGVAKAIIPPAEPERPLTPVEKVVKQFEEHEEARLNAREVAIKKARERARQKGKELGYPDDVIEKMLDSKAVVIGECLWLEQYLDELVQINARHTESPAQELDRAFRTDGARRILSPKPGSNYWNL